MSGRSDLLLLLSDRSAVAATWDQLAPDGLSIVASEQRDKLIAPPPLETDAAFASIGQASDSKFGFAGGPADTN
ncbi:hypothetical protein Pla123a_28240 [Posidoniimonas polymericola]|uniref:Uncharacterized protein n=1 Tax=Posidoniimonas polymericola TaxID=2528002 RepID=A0A5C5YMN8_9BACT|nr:hypothetical protein Pla123a_28240 [Posidoniimonas polymericola]